MCKNLNSIAIAYSKFFPYVAKTLANLSTGNCYGITIFDIDFVKSLSQSIKNLCQLDFFSKSFNILFVLIWVLWVQQKRSDILVWGNFLKSIICD
jgi:hypothetical protein